MITTREGADATRARNGVKSRVTIGRSRIERITFDHPSPRRIERRARDASIDPRVSRERSRGEREPTTQRAKIRIITVRAAKDWKIGASAAEDSAGRRVASDGDGAVGRRRRRGRGRDDGVGLERDANRRKLASTAMRDEERDRGRAR